MDTLGITRWHSQEDLCLWIWPTHATSVTPFSHSICSCLHWNQKNCHSASIRSCYHNKNLHILWKIPYLPRLWHNDEATKVIRDCSAAKPVFFNCLAHYKFSQCSSKHQCHKYSRKYLVYPEVWHKLPKLQCWPQQHVQLCLWCQQYSNYHHDYHTTSATTSLYIAGDNVHLLKTAITSVYANDTGIEANIFLVEGYQRSFIAKSLARILQVQPHHTEHICLALFGSPTTSVVLVPRY